MRASYTMGHPDLARELHDLRRHHGRAYRPDPATHCRRLRARRAPRASGCTARAPACPACPDRVVDKARRRAGMAWRVREMGRGARRCRYPVSCGKCAISAGVRPAYAQLWVSYGQLAHSIFTEFPPAFHSLFHSFCRQVFIAAGTDSVDNSVENDSTFFVGNRISPWEGGFSPACASLWNKLITAWIYDVGL